MTPYSRRHGRLPASSAMTMRMMLTILAVLMMLMVLVVLKRAAVRWVRLGTPVQPADSVAPAVRGSAARSTGPCRPVAPEAAVPEAEASRNPGPGAGSRWPARTPSWRRSS